MEDNKKMCIVHFLPARSGDCFVLEFDNKQCILIDCGYSLTYKEELNPLLQKLSSDGCRIALMIVTHIDADHISGAIDFIEDNGDADHPKIIPVDEIWHNGIANTILNSELFLQHKTEDVPKDIVEKWKRIRAIIKRQLPGRPGEISALQSKQFERLCVHNNYKLNARIKGCCVENNACYSIGNCEVRVLSPGQDEIDDFRKMLDKQLKKEFGADYLWNDSEEFLELLKLISLYYGEDIDGTFTRKPIAAGKVAIQDWLGTSNMSEMNEINRASIVVDIRYGNLKLLFMGDSESELWSKNIDSHYDLIKVSHHGSTKPNLAWMENTIATKLLISTNGGKHGHPEDDFLARVMMGNFSELYFNYNIERKREILEAQKEYQFKVEFEKREIRLEEM